MMTLMSSDAHFVSIISLFVNKAINQIIQQIIDRIIKQQKKVFIIYCSHKSEQGYYLVRAHQSTVCEACMCTCTALDKDSGRCSKLPASAEL